MTLLRDRRRMGLLVTCATRYAMGRLTYMPSTICEIVTDLIPALDNNTLRVLERDLTNHLGTCTYRSCFRDIENQWRKLLADTHKEREKRGDLS